MTLIPSRYEVLVNALKCNYYKIVPKKSHLKVTGGFYSLQILTPSPFSSTVHLREVILALWTSCPRPLKRGLLSREVTNVPTSVNGDYKCRVSAYDRCPLRGGLVSVSGASSEMAKPTTSASLSIVVACKNAIFL